MINLIISSTTDPSFLVMFNKNKKFNINIPLWVKLYMFNMNYSFLGIGSVADWPTGIPGNFPVGPKVMPKTFTFI